MRLFSDIRYLSLEICAAARESNGSFIATGLSRCSKSPCVTNPSHSSALWKRSGSQTDVLMWCLYGLTHPALSLNQRCFIRTFSKTYTRSEPLEKSGNTQGVYRVHSAPVPVWSVHSYIWSPNTCGTDHHSHVSLVHTCRSSGRAGYSI